MPEFLGGFKKWQSFRHFRNVAVELKTDSNIVRFSFGRPSVTNGSPPKQKKVAKTKLSKKAKLNELRLYRLKAKKKKTSPNPEVRIRYSLEKVGCHLQLMVIRLTLSLVLNYLSPLAGQTSGVQQSHL